MTLSGKIAVPKPDQRFVEKLTEQLRFIQRSCAAFDNGAEDEALRIATALRVIFHNTQKSTSLVTHLGFRDAKMLSSARGHGNWQDYLSVRIDVSSQEPVKMCAILGANFRELSVSTYAKNAHLAPIRQFAHETIISVSRFPVAS